MGKERAAIIAHRGSSYAAPENTMAAFRLAWEQGADGIECDARLSRDGQIVCAHDATVLRVGGLDREVASLPYSDLRQIDVGSWKATAFRGERIPLLEDVLKEVSPGKLGLVEIKTGVEILGPLLEMFDRFGGQNRRLVAISFNEEVVKELKRRRPDVVAYQLIDYSKNGLEGPRLEELESSLARSVADGLGVGSLSPHDFELYSRLKSRGLKLNAWTVDDPSMAKELVGRGFDSITTNRPDLLLEAF